MLESFHHHHSDGRLGCGPNGMGFPYCRQTVLPLDFSRYPPSAVNSPVRIRAGHYRKTRRRDPKICRNNNVPVDPFARRRRAAARADYRDGKTIERDGRTGRPGLATASVVWELSAADRGVLLITPRNRKTRESISRGTEDEG